MEKLQALFQSEKIRLCGRKVFNKKTLGLVIAVLVIAAAIRIGFFFMFEVDGTVQNIDGSKITVVNLLNTQTIDVGNYPTTSIKVGDRVEITKNLSGQVLNIRDQNREHMNRNFSGGQDNRGNKRDFRGRR